VILDSDAGTRVKYGMDSDLHLPWDNVALEALLSKVIGTGETTKVDFKQQLNISTAEHHAELLKDISAFSNSYDHAYQNHGFIIFGVSGNKLTYTSLLYSGDAIQAQVDDLVKKYIQPFIPTHVRIFGQEPNTWGVIVIPPTRTAPHVFSKDLHKRVVGDIFVRRGTTTSKANSEDYIRFFRLHLDEHTYELRQQLDDLRSTVRRLEQKSRRQKWKRSAQPTAAVAPDVPDRVGPMNESPDLIDSIDKALAREESPIERGLISEAAKVKTFFQGNSIPWDLNALDKEKGKKVLESIEKTSQTLWQALGLVVRRDKQGMYDQAVIQSLRILASAHEPPVDLTFTDWGRYIRHYPFVASLYAVFIAAACAKRFDILKQVNALMLSRRSYYEEPLPTARTLFHLRRAARIFETQHPNYPEQRWCDSVGMRIESILNQNMRFENEELDWREAFFMGEFLLCLSPLDLIDAASGKPIIGSPSSGTYLYLSEAEPILSRFLATESNALNMVFNRPLKEILREFDATAYKLTAPGCLPSGFAGGAFRIAFPKNEWVQDRN
jgi:hypothetical protein